MISKVVTLPILYLAHLFFPGNRLRNFEIRVGLDDEDIGNNNLCYKQSNSVATGATVMFICGHTLYGDWVSVNKSDHAYLQLCELRVFGSKYVHRILPGLKNNFKLYPITTKETQIHITSS